jgi:hypothetical protein
MDLEFSIFTPIYESYLCIALVSSSHTYHSACSRRIRKRVILIFTLEFSKPSNIANQKSKVGLEEAPIRGPSVPSLYPRASIRNFVRTVIDDPEPLIVQPDKPLI